jgi:hypothetical protein
MVLKAQYNLYRQGDIDYEQFLIEMVVMLFQQLMKRTFSETRHGETNSVEPSRDKPSRCT